jgi:hypothetical protein
LIGRRSWNCYLCYHQLYVYKTQECQNGISRTETDDTFLKILDGEETSEIMPFSSREGSAHSKQHESCCTSSMRLVADCFFPPFDCGLFKMFVVSMTRHSLTLRKTFIWQRRFYNQHENFVVFVNLKLNFVPKAKKIQFFDFHNYLRDTEYKLTYMLVLSTIDNDSTKLLSVPEISWALPEMS